MDFLHGAFFISCLPPTPFDLEAVEGHAQQKRSGDQPSLARQVHQGVTHPDQRQEEQHEYDPREDAEPHENQDRGHATELVGFRARNMLRSNAHTGAPLACSVGMCRRDAAHVKKGPGSVKLGEKLLEEPRES